MNNGIDDVNGDGKDDILVQGMRWCITQKMFKRPFGDKAIEADQPIDKCGWLISFRFNLMRNDRKSSLQGKFQTRGKRENAIRKNYF